MITWHECCESAMGRNPTARLVNHDDPHEDNENRQVDEIAVQRVNMYKSGTNDKLGQVLQSMQEVLKVLGQMNMNNGPRKIVCYDVMRRDIFVKIVYFRDRQTDYKADRKHV